MVCALFHEAKARGKPMTRLADELLAEALENTVSMSIARQQLSAQATNSVQQGRRATALVHAVA